MPQDLNGIVQRMIDAGESEENIATVIQHFKTTSGPTPVSPDEPGTYAGGFMKSVKQTAAETGSGMIRGALRMIDPRTYLEADQAKRAETQRLVRESQQHPDQFPHDVPSAPIVGQLRKMGETLSTPAGGGEAIGGLLTGLALPPVAKGVGRGLQKLAPSVYEMGLNRLPAMKTEFPNAAQRGIQEGIIPTQSRVQQVLNTAEQQTLRPVRAYDAANPPGIDPLIIAAKAGGSAIDGGKLLDRGIRQPALNEVNDLTGQFNAENAVPMTAERVLDLKRAEQGLANPAYRAAEKGRPVGDVEQLWHKGTGSAAREELINKVPETEAALGREQDLIGLLQGAERGANGPSALRHMISLMTGSTGIASGHPFTGIATATANEAMRNPVVMGSAGIGLDRLGGLLANPQMSQAIRAALIARLLGLPNTRDEPKRSP